MPFVENMQRMSFQTQTLAVYQDGSGQFGVLTPKDNNGIDFNVDITIRYAMDKSQICEFLEEKGKKVDNLLVTALRADSTRGVFGKYAQEDIPNNRIEIAEKVRKVLQERLNKEKSGQLKDNFIQILAVDIRNVKYNEKIEQAIIVKQEAKQVAETQEYILDEAQKKREIAIVNANASQEAMVIEAQGRAEAILLEATAKAEGIQKVNDAYQKMPKEYVMVKAFEAIQDNDKVIIGLDSIVREGSSLGLININEMIGGIKQEELIK